VADAPSPPPSGDSPDGPRDEVYPRRRDLHCRSCRRRREAAERGGVAAWTWRRWTVVGLVTALVLVAGVAGFAFWRLNANITKVDVSGQLGTDRPTQAEGTQDAVNILLVGSDTREGAGNDRIGKVVDDPGQHSDTNLLVHLSADRTWASVVSIPRDSMTKAPPDCSSTAPKDQWVTRQWNHNYKIGGIGCLIRTLEGNTGVFVDHYAVVDFRGFQQMVEALGGVEVCTEQPIDDANSGLKLTAGTHTLNGKQALAYVRTRKSLGDGSDLGRIKRQQAFLSSIAQEATSTRLLFQPNNLYSFLDAATRSLTTDPEFDLGTMSDLAQSVRSIGLSNIDFMTVPNEPYPADPNRVQWQKSADVIWASLREDHKVNEKPKASATPSPTQSPLTVSPDQVSVQVLNGSGTPGLANQARTALKAQGFASVESGNAVDAGDGTLVEYSGDNAEAARTVAAAFPGARTEKATGLGSVIRVTLGPGAANVVEVPNRLGSTPLPTPSITAATPSPQPTIETRKASTSICSTS
jgi:LCP family protein required for cell wall assembly